MTGLAPWTAWAAAGVVLLVAEALVPGVFLMWLGVAAIGAGLLTRMCGLGVGAEVASFALLAAVSLGVGRLATRRARPLVNVPGSGLVGRDVVAVGPGRVRLGDSEWPARSVDGQDLSTGPPLRVAAVEGTVLVVARYRDRREMKGQTTPP